ncbi:MAG: CsgG/HfaB family protein [Gemmatimonadaceae bacterium]|nr:CsgG/HfaB family protein [Gemmatimonadaceae bacterium]
MKFVKSFAMLAALAVAVPSLAAAQGGGKPTVAVLYFNNSAIGAANDELQPLTKGTADMLIGELAANPNIRVVERDQIEKVLLEQKLSTDGKVDGESAVKVGKLVGAHYMVTGGFVTDRSGRMRFTARVFNTETSLIIFPAAGGPNGVVNGKIEDFMELVVQLAAKINDGAKLPAMPARVGEARKEAAKKVPYEAIALYSKGLAAKDAGNKAEAVTLFRKSLDKFPSFDKAEAELKKLQ